MEATFWLAVDGLQGIDELPKTGYKITSFFPSWGNVCNFDRIFKGAQDSSKRVKNHSLAGKISYSHEAVTTRQEVSCCRVYTVGVHCVRKREWFLSAGLFGGQSGEGYIWLDSWKMGECSSLLLYCITPGETVYIMVYLNSALWSWAVYSLNSHIWPRWLD